MKEATSWASYRLQSWEPRRRPWTWLPFSPAGSGWSWPWQRSLGSRHRKTWHAGPAPTRKKEEKNAFKNSVFLRNDFLSFIINPLLLGERENQTSSSYPGKVKLLASRPWLENSHFFAYSLHHSRFFLETVKTNWDSNHIDSRSSQTNATEAAATAVSASHKNSYCLAVCFPPSFSFFSLIPAIFLAGTWPTNDSFFFLSTHRIFAWEEKKRNFVFAKFKVGHVPTPPTFSHFLSFNIRGKTFINYVKFADLQIARL